MAFAKDSGLNAQSCVAAQRDGQRFASSHDFLSSTFLNLLTLIP
ncbi:hypothetical protein [Olivibacter domesticus]|nr:hypothetical protein [Olivibacter domesticus]